MFVRQHDEKWARQAQRELRQVLNAWDPIGIFDGDPESSDAPQDEYDCVRDTLISRLLAGAGRESVRRFLEHELSDHFEIEPSLVTPELVERIFDWWESAR